MICFLVPINNLIALQRYENNIWIPSLFAIILQINTKYFFTRLKIRNITLYWKTKKPETFLRLRLKNRTMKIKTNIELLIAKI